MRKLQITDFELEQAFVLYKAGSPIRKLAKEIRLSEESLVKILKEKGIYRTKQESARGGKSDAIIYDNALDILTPEALYWIGFIYADGHLAKDRPRIVLGLATIDKDHLQKFADFFGSGIKVFESDKPGKERLGYLASGSWRVQFSSTKIYNRLIQLGIEPRKTYNNVIVNELLRNSRDFWRGVIDGDGCIYINKQTINGIKYERPVLTLAGNECTINCFLEYVRSLGIEVNATIRKSKRSAILCETYISANKLIMNTLNTLKILYKDSTIYLDRKYEKYLEVINKYEKPTI